MKTKKLKTWAGDSIQKLAADAVMLAKVDGRVSEFDFNGVQCLANANTDPDLLVRDYLNAHLMNWKTIGPDCAATYSKSVQAELTRKQAERDAESEKSRQDYNRRMYEREQAITMRTAGIDLFITDEAAYDSYVEKNTDPYGAGIVRYAEQWGRLMQAELAAGKTIAECAQQTSHDADTEGITGFMYGAAVSMLAQCWQHGEDLRKWHNGEYGHKGSGVVNPAVLTITPA